jgi:protein KTI12
LNEEALKIHKNNAYEDAPTEKTTRATLKAAVERHLSKNSIVIADSLNYIKGYRYELFCIARAAGTPLAVLWCDTPRALACEWNELRENAMPTELFQELSMRFEPPNPRNRWDSPLFTLAPDDGTPLEAILQATVKTPGLRPNLATQSQPLADTNFVHELERITNDIITTALATINAVLPGDLIPVPHSNLKIICKHTFTMAELRRLRKQFF